MSSKNVVHAQEFRPLHNKVFVTNMDRGVRKTAAGIIIPDDDMTERGIRPRWSQVYAVGPEVDDLVPGDWIMVAHGRWTQGIDLELNGETTRIWSVEYPESVLLVADTDPREAQPTPFNSTYNR